MPETPDQKPPKDLLDWLGITDAPNWRVARLLGPIIALIFFVLFALALAATFIVIVKAAFGDSEVTLGIGGLIAALLGAPFLIWGTVLKNTTVRYQKEGHMTDRINKAVEMLGAEKTISYVARNITHPALPPEERDYYENDYVDRLQRINLNTDRVKRIVGKEHDFHYGEWQVFTETVPNLEVRIGAILSLERIAQDSTSHDKGRDHVRVMEILCAYIRNNSRASSETEVLNHQWDRNIPPSSDSKASNELRSWASAIPMPRADISIAIKVLKFRNKEQIKIERSKHEIGVTGYQLDLSYTNLQKTDLNDGNFCNVNFRGSLFDKAMMSNADFRHANLLDTSAIMASARGSKFAGANLGVNFTHAILDESEFTFIEDDRPFSSFNGRYAKFKYAQLHNARIRFRGDPYSFRNWVIGADFSNAHMQGCIFDGFNNLFEHQWPERFNDAGKREKGLAFYRCELTKNIVDRCSLAWCFGDGSVTIPEGTERPRHWPTAKLSWHDYKIQYEIWRSDPFTFIHSHTTR
ncbi:pentapeptide repeat-containing protein [Pararhodobacter oceanensis]|uniref:Pentapeptide repeat-containing protein n=1 Tax=Pararhodobacter oceanensis TaxID=2172121 RepID=A0A2T8HT32_9RHOB|nr:pentapeptide repeat-containing protein [Pararhodobacter oceanensis]PVH28608.1 hypothetical protein DDE20_10420 [Pararhodobacter oceanensis]